MTRKLDEVAQLIRALYATEDGAAGCCLHVLTDDGNYGKGTAEFCAEFARQQEHPGCVRIAQALALMSPSQQKRAAELGKASQPAPAEPTSPEPQGDEVA